MDLNWDVFMVIQPGAFQLTIIEPKSQRLDQVQPATSIGAKPNDIPGVGRNFGLEKNDIEHFLLQFVNLQGLIL